MAEIARPFDSQSVCRAIIRSTWIDEQDGTLSFGAFMLIAGDPGLSVNYGPGCSQEYLNTSFSGCYGAAHLKIRELEELSLDVVPDPLTGKPYHALIVGLPEPGTTIAQRQEAERLAGILARKARTVTWSRAKKRK